MLGLFLALSTSSARAQWPQWGGTNRNFAVDTKNLADSWAAEGPKKLWQRPLGDGYSSIVVDGNVLYTMYRKDEADEWEYTVALDATTGKTIWEHKFRSPLAPNSEYAVGPNSTPLVSGDHVFSIDTSMVLRCFHKTTGKSVWQRDLAAEFGKPLVSYGYACSPLAHGGNVILAVGGRGAASTVLAAFDQNTGNVAWKNTGIPRVTNNRCEYSSPILINLDGEDQIVYLTNEQLTGLNPASGELIWTHPNPTGVGRNISTPVWNGKDTIFCSAAYDSGSRVVKLTLRGGVTTSEELWFSRNMKLHFGNAVIVGDHVYGSSGDQGPAFLMAAELGTGKILWRERNFKKATCLYADGKLIILDEDGQLALATITPDGLTVHSTSRVTEHRSWTPPTLVGTKLFVRDRKQILALDLG